MCSKVLNGHIILTDTSITTILAPEMTYTPKKTAFVPCKSFKHDGATLTVGVAEVTVNRKPNPSEVYLCVKYFGDEGTPEAVVTFTPDKVIEIAEALLGFARVAHKQDGRV